MRTTITQPAPLLFKVLNVKHYSVYQEFDYTPYLPKGKQPGRWLPAEKKLGLCNSGWHFTVRPELHWGEGGAEPYLAETRGGRLIGEGDKVSATSGRLITRVDEKWEWLPLYPAIRALLYSAWRKKNPAAEIPDWADLSGADLSGADLSGADLSGADLSRADLSGANLYRADLSRADLSRADLYGADLSRANLYGADLSGADNAPPLPTTLRRSRPAGRSA